MAGGFVGQLVEAIMNGPEGSPAANMSIAGIDPTDPSGRSLILPERSFQFWPESIQDSIEIGWQFKDIPGSSHALAQWSGNNGRTITFEVRLHRFMKPVADRTKPFEWILDPFEMTGPGGEYLKDMRPHNVDIEAELRYLRAFCYPSYGEIDSARVSYPPPVALLCIPGLALNEFGGDVIMAVMTSCDVTYTLCFPNGKPRFVSVSLAFKQVVQSGGGVIWRGIGKDPKLNGYMFKSPDGELSPDAASTTASSGITNPVPGGGRGTNDIKAGEDY